MIGDGGAENEDDDTKTVFATLLDMSKLVLHDARSEFCMAGESNHVSQAMNWRQKEHKGAVTFTTGRVQQGSCPISSLKLSRLSRRQVPNTYNISPVFARKYGRA